MKPVVNFSDISVQDINGNIFREEYVLRQVANDLVNNGILTEKKASKIKEVVFCRLVGNIDPHEDQSFVRIEQMQNRALLHVFDEKYDGKYEDSSTHTYFYHARRLREVSKGDSVWFDASKEHAFFTSGKVNIMTVWFGR